MASDDSLLIATIVYLSLLWWMFHEKPSTWFMPDGTPKETGLDENQVPLNVYFTSYMVAVLAYVLV